MNDTNLSTVAAKAISSAFDCKTSYCQAEARTNSRSLKVFIFAALVIAGLITLLAVLIHLETTSSKAVPYIYYGNRNTQVQELVQELSDRIDRRLDKMDAEASSEQAVENRRYDVWLERYRQSLKKGEIPN